MKIIIIYQYFGTPKGSWSTRIYELSRRWIKEGHEVEVITSPYEKSDIRANGFISQTKVEGVNVTIINSGDNNRLPYIYRLFRGVTFAFISTFFALYKRYDILLTSSGPITVGIPLIISKIFRKGKTVFEVRDLWPAGAIELGILKNKFLIRIAYWFEKQCYKFSDLVVTASIGQEKKILERFSYLRTLVIPNTSNNDFFGKLTNVQLSKEFINHKILLHIGSLGLIHNIYFWLDIAEELKKMKIKDTKFIFIGEGVNRDELEQIRIKKGLENVHFLGLMPKEELPKWLHSSYATLFATTDNPVQDTSSPNKIFDSFAAGVPVIQTSKGWIKELFEVNDCGISLDVTNIQLSALKIKNYLNNIDERNKHSVNVKKLAIKEFDTNILSNKYLDELKKIYEN